MSKLLKLKKWSTLEGAAEYISNKVGEKITVPDLYRLALERHIQLSVNLVNYVMIKKGKLLKGTNFGSKAIDPYAYLDEEILSTRGVWDLAMIGDEISDIEHHYQQATSGLEISTPFIAGVFLKRGDEICQLQTDLEDEEELLGSKAAKKELDKYLSNNDVDSETASRLLAEYDQNRKEFLNIRKNQTNEYHYARSSGLDAHDYVFVIRTDEIHRVIQRLNDTPQEAKPLTSKERNSLLVLIGALCKEANVDPMQRGIATSLVKMTELIGAPLTDDTVRKILKQVQPAVDSRVK
ncbi:hypothetical protein MT390_13985 [Vibrio sp. 2-Bac 85]